MALHGAATLVGTLLAAAAAISTPSTVSGFRSELPHVVPQHARSSQSHRSRRSSDHIGDDSDHPQSVQHWHALSPAGGQANDGQPQPAMHTREDYEAVVGPRGATIWAAFSQLEEAGVPLSSNQVLLKDHISLSLNMATAVSRSKQLTELLVQQRSSQQGAVSGNKSEGQQARESELHEELRRVQAGVRYEPNSTGILMVGGGRDQLGNALVTLQTLRGRYVGCTLPVELIHQAEDANDVPDTYLLALLQDPGLAPIRLVQGGDSPEAALFHPQAPGIKDPYAFKVYALAFLTTFQHVLLLDTDSLPLQDPSSLFSSPEYRRHGNLFWPDFWHDDSVPGIRPPRQLYEAFQMPVPWDLDPHHRMAETGQVLFDRGRHWDVLHWAWLLSSHPDPLEQYLHGDKDAFLVAFFLAGKVQEYQQVRWFAREVLAAMDTSKHGQENPWHHMGMLQMHPDGTPGFHHRTAGAKWFPYCLDARREMEDVQYCRVSHICSPTTPAQAAWIMSDRGGYFKVDDVDVHVWEAAKCSSVGELSDTTPLAAPAWAAAPQRVGAGWALEPSNGNLNATTTPAVISYSLRGQFPDFVCMPQFNGPGTQMPAWSFVRFPFAPILESAHKAYEELLTQEPFLSVLTAPPPSQPP